MRLPRPTVALLTGTALLLSLTGAAPAVFRAEPRNPSSAVTADAAGAAGAAGAADDDLVNTGSFNMAGGNKGNGPGRVQPDQLVERVKKLNARAGGRIVDFLALQETCQTWTSTLRERLNSDGYRVEFRPTRHDPQYEPGQQDPDNKFYPHPKDLDHEPCKMDPDEAERNSAESDLSRIKRFGRGLVLHSSLGIDAGNDGIVAYDLGSSGREKREMLCAKSTERRIVICSVHLRAGTEREDDVKGRQAEAKVAFEVLQRDFPGYTQYVGGDFNIAPKRRAVNGTCADWDTDDWAKHECTLNAFYDTYKEVDDKDKQRTYPKNAPNAKIDYLFVSKCVPVHRAFAGGEIKSDHKALWARVGIIDGRTCHGGGGDPGNPPLDSPPTVSAGPDASGAEGAAVALSGAASDDGGVPAVRWTYRAQGGTDPGARCRFGSTNGPSTALTCTDNGSYIVTLTGNDGVNPPVSDSATVVVRNAAPELRLTGPEPWRLYRIGDTVALRASFTDAGGNDTHTCRISWDDGSTTVRPAADGGCDRTHVFDRAGMYTVKAIVTDDDGASGSASVMVVVYDPRAGVLAGTGTAGGAGFTALAKYPAVDSTSPAGTLALSARLQDGRLRLLATDLEWLVITPGGRSALKGTARLNGRTGYGFVAYATAGHFRAVVWPVSDGENPPVDPLYDSNLGAGYDVDVAEPQPMSTGVILIDSGWVPGLPRPVGSILDGLL